MIGTVEGAGYAILDAAFRDCIIGHARIERLWTGARWSEGIAYFPAGRYAVWSDIPNDRLLRWDETDGSVSVFRAPSMHANGNTVDRQGRLVTCEHRARRVTRTEHDGGITVLADAFEGRRLNSPNDVVVKSDGSVWFTDPHYGLVREYEGGRGTPEIGASNVYRIDPATGAVTMVATGFDQPNGLAFDPAERWLCVSDTGGTGAARTRHIRRLTVAADGRGLVAGGETMARCTNGIFDGFRFDTAGRIWSSAHDGVHCLAPDGRLIGKLRIPEKVANVCFAGTARNRLLIAGSTSLYAVFLNVRGAA